MNPPDPHHYTAAQIGRALNITRQAILSRLAQTPSGTVVVCGQSSRAWSFASLPQSLQSELEKAMQERGCRDVHHLLTSEPAQPYALPIPWAAIPENHRQNAEKLCTALATALARQHELPGPDLMQFAADQYRRVFRNEVSPDRLRFVMDRATKRDNGFKQWQCPALYLDDAAFHAAPVVPVQKPGLHAKLDDVLSTVKDKSNPTPEDRRHIFSKSFRHMEAAAVEHPSTGEQRAFKQSLIQYLYNHVPGLHRPQAASDAREGKPLLTLRSQFNRVYQSWIAQGRPALLPADGRAHASGRKPKAIPAKDLVLYEKEAVANDGNQAGTFRRLHTIGAFSPEFSEQFPFDPQNKSHVPRALIRAATPGILTKLDSRRGAHYMQMHSPKVARDWRKVAPYAWLSLDDVTFNHPFAVRSATGKIRIVRGECILDCATRALYIPHYTLIAGQLDDKKTSFNAWHVRGNILAVHDKIGLPYEGLELEHNVFAARLLRGDRRPGWRQSETRSFEPGLRHADLDLDLHYHQPGTPWTKVIERVIGMVQDRMNCEPNYVGRNQRLDKREYAEKVIREVESGKLTPEQAGILWFDQFTRLLDAVIREYNREIQNGEMLMEDYGLYRSPEDAFLNGICGQPGYKDRPAKYLTPEGRARLSTHQRPMYVGNRGLNIDIDGRRYPFFDENLEPYRHKEILAYLNIETPEVLICSDIKQTHFFQVKLQRYDAMDASQADLKGMNQDRSKLMQRSKVAQSNLRPPLISVITRDGTITQATETLGETVNAAVEQHKEEQAQAAREHRIITRKAGILGREVSSQPRNAARVSEGLDLEAEARAEIAALNKEQTP